MFVIKKVYHIAVDEISVRFLLDKMLKLRDKFYAA